LYSKPFEESLREEMHAKFKPIEQGIVEFLEPVLRDLMEEGENEEEEEEEEEERQEGQVEERQEREGEIYGEDGLNR